MLNKFHKLRFSACLLTLFVLCLVLFATQSKAAVSFDGRNSGGAFSNTGVPTLTWSHTIGTGSNRALLVGVSTTSAAGVGNICSGIPGGCTPLSGLVLPVTAVTYNGISLAKVDSTGDLNVQVSIWQLVNPPSGTADVVVSFAAGTVTQAEGNSVSFFGVDQTAPIDAAGNSTSNSSSPGETLSDAGIGTDDMAFDTLASTPGAGFFGAAADQTVCTDESVETTCTRGRRFFSTAYDIGASSIKQAGAGSVTTSWTMTNSTTWYLSAAVINAAPLPPPTAATVSISGRVKTPTGRGIMNVHLSLTDSEGNIRVAASTSFGYYHFDAVEVGKTYIISANGKHFSFSQPTQILNLNEEASRIDFVADNEKGKKNF